MTKLFILLSIVQKYGIIKLKFILFNFQDTYDND
jgi:hypothetical protein